MLFDSLSNAAYRVSIGRPGAELEGAINAPPHLVVEDPETQQVVG